MEPILAALADRDDLLVVVTPGGRPVENVRGPVPPNARIKPFLEYEALLPKISPVVTNGGYGTVSLALRAGVPVVAAGRTEDKAEAGARVALSGVGVELASNAPSVEALRGGIARALEEPSFRERARAMTADFATLDMRREVFAIIDRLARKEAADVMAADSAASACMIRPSHPERVRNDLGGTKNWT